MREEFAQREKNMKSVDKFLSEEMPEILERGETYQMSGHGNPDDHLDSRDTNCVLGQYFL